MKALHPGAQLDVHRGHQLLSYLSFPAVSMARTLLTQYVCERPLRLERQGSDARHNDASRAFLQHYRSLVPEMMDQAMALGIVLLYVPKVSSGERDSSHDVAVVPWGSVSVTCEVDPDTYKRTWVVQRATNPSQDVRGEDTLQAKDVYVMDVFGSSAPDPRTGTYRSLMATVEPHITMFNALLRTTVVAEHLRSRPACYLEHEHVKSDTSTESVQYGYWADSGQEMQRNAENSYNLNANDVKMLQLQRQLFAEYAQQSRMTADAQQQEIVDRGQIAAASMASLAPLPQGTHVTRGAESRAPDDLVAKMRHVEGVVMSIMGAPRSFVLHDQTVRHDAAMLHCTVIRTVSWWQHNLAACFTHAYNTQHSRKIAKQQKSRKTMYVTHSVAFQPQPRVAQPTLDQLYLRGVVDWGTYQRKTAALAGFLDHEIADARMDPFTHEEKMALLGLKMGAPDSIETEKSANSG